METTFDGMLASFLEELAHIFPRNPSLRMASVAVRAGGGESSARFWSGIQPYLERVFAKDATLFTSGELATDPYLHHVASDLAGSWAVLPSATQDCVWEYLHMLSGMAMGLHGLDASSREAVAALSSEAARQLGDALPLALESLVARRRDPVSEALVGAAEEEEGRVSGAGIV